MKNNVKIMGIAIIIVCLVVGFAGSVIRQPNKEEETSEIKTKSHYSDGDNEIDKKIVEISNDKKHILKSQSIDNVYDYVIESNIEYRPSFLTTKEDGLNLGCDMIDIFIEYLE